MQLNSRVDSLRGWGGIELWWRRRSGSKERTSWKSSEEPRVSASLALPIHSAAARAEPLETDDAGRQSSLELASAAAAVATTREESGAPTADTAGLEDERQHRVELDDTTGDRQAPGSPEATTPSPWIGDTALEEESGHPAAAADIGELDQGVKHLSAHAGEPRASSAPTGPEDGGDGGTSVHSGNETVSSTADDGVEQLQASSERTESSTESALDGGVDRADGQGESTAELDERTDVRANATTTRTTLLDANTTNLTTLVPPQAAISASAIAAALSRGGGAAKRRSDSGGGGSKASASPPSASKAKLDASTAQYLKLLQMRSNAGGNSAKFTTAVHNKQLAAQRNNEVVKTQMLAAMTIQADAQAQTGAHGSGISGGQQRWSQLQKQLEKQDKALTQAEGEDASSSVPSEVLDSRDARYKARMAALRQVMQGHASGRAKLKPWMVDLLLPVGTTKELGLHVVFTHFLLGRGHLATLAELRFELLAALTLPSMVQQSSRSFIWIVYVDERLPVAVRTSMQALMQAHKQFHVVVVDPAKMHPSSMKLAPQLALAHELYPNLLEFVDLVLYTRVDADDALERSVLSTLQEKLETFEQRATYRWLCWQDSLTWVPRGLMGVPYDSGRVFMSSASAQCSPAGLTMVSRLGMPHPVFQKVMHTRVRKLFGAAKDHTPEVPCADPPPMPSERNPPACLQEMRSPLMASMRSVTLASNSLGLFHPRKVLFTSNRSLDTWTFTHRTLGREPEEGRGKAPAVVVAGGSKSRYAGLAPGVEWDGPSEAVLKRGFGVDRVKLTKLSDVFGDADTSLRLVTELQALPPCQSSWGCYVSPGALATALGNYQRSVMAHVRDEPMQHKAHGKVIVAAEAASVRAAADDHHLPRCGAAEQSHGGSGGLLGWIASVTHRGADSSTRLCRVPDDARHIAAEGWRGAEEEASIYSADRGNDTETEMRPGRVTEPEKPAAKVGVTLVTQATVNYVPFILEIAKRWAPCPMSSAIYGKLTEFNQLMAHNELEFPTNLKLVFEKVVPVSSSFRRTPEVSDAPLMRLRSRTGDEHQQELPHQPHAESRAQRCHHHARLAVGCGHASQRGPVQTRHRRSLGGCGRRAKARHRGGGGGAGIRRLGLL